jgi:hypothetical protein
MQNSPGNEPSHGGRETSPMSWFDHPTNVRKIVIGLIVICCIALLSDFLYTNDHPHFSLETVFGFQAWVGFLAFVVIVFLGRLLRIIVRREENYYD